MSDPTSPAPVQPPVTPATKPGWKTTEMWAAMLAMGAIGWALKETISVIPAIASNPALPAWAAPILSLAPIGLGWLLKLTAGEYGQLRNDLKLGSDPTLAAIAAGAGAASASVTTTITEANK